jgi:hypothetical protein
VVHLYYGNSLINWFYYFYLDTGMSFYFDGKRWLDQMEEEIADRLVNDAVLIFDTTHHHHAPKTPTSASAVKSLQNNRSNTPSTRVSSASGGGVRKSASAVSRVDAPSSPSGLKRSKSNTTFLPSKVYHEM